jgi:hypothetical protein
MGWLVEHKASVREIADLLALADRDLGASRTVGLDADWRLNIAYNAALQAATAALAACGFRAEREAHHYRVVQSLALTVGADVALVQLLDQFRRKRNLGAYERAGMVSDQEAEEICALAAAVRNLVVAWLEKEHPELLGKRSV